MAGYFDEKVIKEIIRDVQRCAAITAGKQDLVFRSLPRPNNVIDWVISEKFLTTRDIDIYENRGQYYALREFFQCFCPVCSDFKSRDVFTVSKEALLNDKLLVYDWGRRVEYCPICGITKNEFIDEGMLKPYSTLLAIVGMRAGKTTLAAMMMTYMEAILTCSEDAKDFFGVSSVPFIEIGCIAVSAEQAKDTIWAQYRTFRANSRWFTMLKTIMRDEGYIKEELYEELDNSIRNDVVGLRIQSWSSSSATLAGRTRAMFIVDELGRFDTTDSKRSAKEVWRVGDHSLKTVRKNVDDKRMPPWMGAMVAIGSPISIDDYSMKMFGAEESQNMCKMKFSTWEFNPKFNETDFEDEYKRDPIAADRDFGADPPGSERPFFEDWALTTELAEDRALFPFLTFQDTVRIFGGVTYIGKAVMEIHPSSDEWFIGCDAGKSKDTFAIVGCKRIWTGNAYLVLQGFAMHILPNKKKRKYVDYNTIVPFLERLCEKWKVQKICFDNWNSDSIVQELQAKGIPAEQYAMTALRVEDFMGFKSALMSGRVKLIPRMGNEDGDPEKMDSQTRLYWEMRRMQRSKDLKKVDHSPNSTSDLFEAMVNCYRLASTIMVNQPSDVVRTMGQVIRFGRW